MDDCTYSEPTTEINGNDWDKTRFERWLGAPGTEHEATPSPAAPSSSTSSLRTAHRRGTRLERLLGVAPAGDMVRPDASPTAQPIGHEARRAGAGIDASRYAVIAAVGAAVGMLGLGAWAINLQGQVSNLKKAVAAEASNGASVTRQVTEAKTDIDRIGSRLDDVERLDPQVQTIDERLTEVERRLGRRK